MTRKKSKRRRGEKSMVAGDASAPALPPSGSPAVPPPDDPMRRHAQDPDVSDREAARLRLEAILQTRSMPETDDGPKGNDGS